MKKLLNVLAGLMVAGCISDKRFPCAEDFYKLCDEEYEFGINDCSNKAGRLTRELRERGYSADVIIIDDNLTDQISHTIIRVKFRGKDFYLDPTKKECYWKIPDGFQIIKKVDDIELYHNLEYRKIIGFKSSS